MAMVCSTLVIQAEGKSLFITFNDGSKAEFAMADNPSISWADGTMKVVAGTTTVSYDLWRVKQFTFGTTTGIHATDGSSLRVKADGVSVYTMDGKAVSVPVLNGEASLSSLPKGTYIVNINGNIFKILKP